jgi:hypothetical protein
MNTQNLATTLPSLAAVAVGAVRTSQRGRILKVYRPEKRLTLNANLELAIRRLVELRCEVRVYEDGNIWSPVLGTDGVVIWNHRRGRKVRKNMKVEVIL